MPKQPIIETCPHCKHKNTLPENVGNVYTCAKCHELCVYNGEAMQHPLWKAYMQNYINGLKILTSQLKDANKNKEKD